MEEYPGRVDRRHPIGNVLDAIGDSVRIAHLVPTLHADGPEIGLVDLAGAAPQADIDMIVIGLSISSDIAEISALRRRVCRWPSSTCSPGIRGRSPAPPSCCASSASRSCTRTCRRPTSWARRRRPRNRIPAVSTLHRIHNEPADRVDRLKRSAKILARQRFMTRTIAISQVQREWYRSLAGPETDVLLVPNGVVDPGVPDDALRGPPPRRAGGRARRRGRAVHRAHAPRPGPRAAARRRRSAARRPAAGGRAGGRRPAAALAGVPGGRHRRAGRPRAVHPPPPRAAELLAAPTSSCTPAGRRGADRVAAGDGHGLPTIATRVGGIPRSSLRHRACSSRSTGRIADALVTAAHRRPVRRGRDGNRRAGPVPGRVRRAGLGAAADASTSRCWTVASKATEPEPGNRLDGTG